jgi:hypothetical protein
MRCFVHSSKFFFGCLCVAFSLWCGGNLCSVGGLLCFMSKYISLSACLDVFISLRSCSALGLVQMYSDSYQSMCWGGLE